jgi:phenylpropionate dioxygenase-like ring-hydroxylating dioxygenase large terminal subunit
VIGDSVRCPFHGWRYDGATGACVEIPYCDKIPQKARVRAWEVVERNQMIFVWHHAEEKPSSWEVPEAPQLSDPNWSDARTWELEIPVHIQDMAENNLDPVHFQYVHGMARFPETEITYDGDGRLMRAESESDQETPMGTFRLKLVRETWCIGMASVTTIGVPEAGLYMFSSTSPIDHNTTYTRWALTATNNMVDIAGEEWFKGMTTGVMDDWRIWKNKIHRAEPVLCEADTMLAEFRRWTKQFYSPQT